MPTSHLFVLVHGLWGTPRHMVTIEKMIQNLVKNGGEGDENGEEIVTLRCNSFSFWRTYDGISINALKVIDELLYEIELLSEKGSNVVKISFIGYSLGGLIVRNVIGKLYDLGFFKKVKPIFFTTFATPHVGIEFFKSSYFDKFANRCGKYLFGSTGLELFVRDKERLLLKMATPSSLYFQGLILFEKHILLANIKHDRSVAFFTSYITEYSPFEDLGSIKIKYIKHLPQAKIGNVLIKPKFVDLNRSYFIPQAEISTFSGNIQEKTSLLRSNKLIRTITLFFVIFVFLPIWIPIVATTSTIISIYSIVKIRIFSPKKVDHHWNKVLDTVYGSSPIDSDNLSIGQKNRSRRNSENLYKRGTSELVRSTMDRVIEMEDGEEENVEEENDEDNGIDTPRISQRYLSSRNSQLSLGQSSGTSTYSPEQIKQDRNNLNDLISKLKDFNKDKRGGSSSVSERINQEREGSSTVTERINQERGEVSSSVNSNQELVKRNSNKQVTSKPNFLINIEDNSDLDLHVIPNIGKINLTANDLIAKTSVKQLQRIPVEDIPIFNSKSKLNLDETKKQIVSNLNSIDWVKIPVYIDAWNSHDGIVARRGAKTNPKGTSTIGLYCSILRNHLNGVE